MEPISSTAALSCVKTCIDIVLKIQDMRSGLQFHRRKGAELVRRCELLMEYLKEVIESGPIQQTAAGALEQLQEHLVRAYEILRNCSKGRVYRVINYRAIQDEIVDVNTSISACLGDYHFFNSVPRASQPHLKQLRADVRTYGALSVKEDVIDCIPPEASDLDGAESASVAETVQMLAQQGVFSLSELRAFQEEVLANDAEREQMLRLVGIVGEEQQMLVAQKMASEEEYLKQIAELIARTEQAEPLAPPERFLCPLTCDPMTDPVILTSGRIYERSAIERWLQNHNTCPINRVPVDPTVLIPVFDLRAEILEWTASNGSSRTPSTSSSTLQLPTDASSIAVRLVRELDTSEYPRLLNTLKQLQGMATNAANQKAIAAVPGSLQRLVGLLDSGSENVQEQAAGLLMSLAMDVANQKAIATVPGSLQRLVGLLDSGSEGVQEQAAGLLMSLQVDTANQKAIAAVPGSLQRLVGLLDSGSDNVQERPAEALSNLATDAATQKAIAAVPGSLQPLMGLLDSRNEGVQEQALLALAYDAANLKALAAVPERLQRLVGMLDSGSEGVQEVVAEVLANLAADAANKKVIIAVPGSLQKLTGLKYSRNAAVQMQVNRALANLGHA
jgi:hypothetical protein